MHKTYTSKPFWIGFCLLFGSFALTAQTIEYLNANNVKVGIGVGGNLFTAVDSLYRISYDEQAGIVWDQYEVPKGSGKTEIYTAALWMCAEDGGGNAFVAANRYFDYGIDYFDGPVATIYNSNYDTFYRRVFKVSRTQVMRFINLSFPTTKPQVDSAILYWPAKGNPSVLTDYGVSITENLAPFIDLNNNGIYEPLLGDYPSIPGDENIFFVFNDGRGLHSETNGAALNVEIRGMASSFSDTNTCIASNGSKALNNTIFVQYQIENKSQIDYHNFNLGIFTDPDIGCPENDFVGCDSIRSLMFAYNATSSDMACDNNEGYDSLPVALGVQWLNQTMNAFGIYTGISATPSLPEPEGAIQYCNQMSGYWTDGLPFRHGGTGYDDTTGYITKFLYSGDPNDTTEWSEVQAHNPLTDQAMYGATESGDFLRGEIKHYDFAFITSYDITSNNIGIVDTLKLAADQIKRFYNNCLLPEQVLSVVELENNTSTISIYPNPANNQVTIASSDYMKLIELMDIQGRLLLTETVSAKTTTLPVSNLAKGVYLVSIQCAGGSVVRRIVVE